MSTLTKSLLWGVVGTIIYAVGGLCLFNANFGTLKAGEEVGLFYQIYMVLANVSDYCLGWLSEEAFYLARDIGIGGLFRDAIEIALFLVATLLVPFVMFTMMGWTILKWKQRPSNPHSDELRVQDK